MPSGSLLAVGMRNDLKEGLRCQWRKGTQRKESAIKHHFI